MTGRPAPGEGLSDGVRASLIEFLTDELSDLWSSAVAAGGSERRLVEAVDRRRRLLAAARWRDPGEAGQ